VETPDGGSSLQIKGFGLEGSARGNFVVALALLAVTMLAPSAVIAVVALKGFERLEKGFEGLEKVIRESGERGDRVAIGIDQARATLERHTKILDRISCDLRYTPDERKAIRKRIEDNPTVAAQLDRLYCPQL
jgi:hypothetical protein